MLTKTRHDPKWWAKVKRREVFEKKIPRYTAISVPRGIQPIDY